MKCANTVKDTVWSNELIKVLLQFPSMTKHSFNHATRNHFYMRNQEIKMDYKQLLCLWIP